MSLIEQLKSIIEPVLEDMGEELVEATLFKKGGRLTLSLTIDKEDGVTLDDTTEASRHISDLLDRENLIKEPYNLEVSSPGIERVLTKPAHYVKFVGSEVVIKAKEALEGQRKFTGIIKSADDKAVKVESAGREIKIPYENISKANLKVEISFK